MSRYTRTHSAGFEYDMRDVRKLRTHWLISHSMTNRSYAKPSEIVNLELNKHRKEHDYELTKVASGKEKLDLRWSGYTQFKREDAFNVDAMSFSLETTYLVFPTRKQVWKRKLTGGRWS